MKKNNLVKSTLILSAGQFISQFLILITLPFLTALYSPKDFGFLAAFVGAANILSSFFVLKLDLALLLPKSNLVAKELLNFISKLPLLFFLILFILFMFFESTISRLMDIQKPFIYLILLTAMFITYAQIYLSYRNRQEKYILMSISRVLLVVSTIILQICFISFFKINSGLVYGLIVGQFIYFIILGHLDIREIFTLINKSKKKYLAFFKKYKDFPIYTLPSSFLNVSVIQLIPIILLFYFGAEVAGLVFIIQKLLGAPFGLLGESLKQVVYKKMSIQSTDSKKLYKLVTSVVLITFFLASFIMLVIYVLLPYIFKYLFSPEYYQSVGFFFYLIPLYIFQLAISPILSIVFVMKKQKEYFIWEIFRFIIVISVLILGGIKYDIFTTLLLFSISQAALYTIIFIFICYWLKKSFFKELKF